MNDTIHEAYGGGYRGRGADLEVGKQMGRAVLDKLKDIVSMADEFETQVTNSLVENGYDPTHVENTRAIVDDLYSSIKAAMRMV